LKQILRGTKEIQRLEKTVSYGTHSYGHSGVLVFIILPFGIRATSMPSPKEKYKEANVRANFFLLSILMATYSNTARFHFYYSSLLSLVLAITSFKAGPVIVAC